MSGYLSKIRQAFNRKKASFLARYPGLKQISFKLTFVIFLMSVVPLLAASYFVFSYVKSDLRAQIIEGQVLIAEAQEGHVLSFLESLKRETLEMTYNVFISRSLEKIVDKKPDARSAAKELNAYLSSIKNTFNSKIYGINIIDNNGFVVASTDAAEIGRNEGQDDYFTKTIGLAYDQTFLSDIVVGHHFVVGNNPFLIAASPLVREQDGKTIGVIAKYFKTHYLDDLLSGRYQEELGAVSGILGRNKTLDIYLVNKDKLLVTKSRFLGNEAFMTQTVDTDPVRACLSGHEEVTGVWNNYLGDKVLGVAMCLRNLGWVLVVEEHENEAFQLITLLNRNVNIFILLMFVSVAAFGIYVARKIVRPVTSLSRIAQEIAAGKLSTRTNIESEDEIGMLACNFNEMAKSLSEKDKENKQKTAELKEKVAELESFNKFAVGRELKMIELKEEIKRLKGEKKQ